ncbi:MAG: aldo/keto reductase [Chloroflexi bacterium HGW-Chloroflexi-10]|nr:MAG: aldo/keto reductase [Chloroflexi bacterium HGW-Chloroflexi-10]
MEKRIFGRTGHTSTVAIFGGAAFWDISQTDADRVMEKVIAAGVNHIDVAPSYGMAEERIGPWMPRERQRFFLGCKTMERTAAGAWNELHASLKRLQVEQLDLYQIHAITTQAELDEAMRSGGAIDTLIKARQSGLTRYLGITGHGMQTPQLFLQAIQRFDFDTLLFPINYGLYARAEYRAAAEELLAECRRRKVGTMIIKSITRAPWGDRPKTHTTWYEPFSTPTEIQLAIDFALSQDVTGICTAGDTSVLPLVLQACENFKPMSQEKQEELIQTGAKQEMIF